jgi:uncharacterized protein (DUF4415 family)
MIKKSVGRPKVENKKVSLTIRVSQDVKNWLLEQPKSAGITLDELIKDKMKEEEQLEMKV